MKKMLLPVLVFTLSFSMLSCAASFDCTKASSKTEKMICADLRTSELDSLMDRAYKRALSKALNPNDVKQNQRNWLKQRNQCTDIACVKQQYEQQLTQLREIQYAPQKWEMLKGERSELCQAVFNLVKNDPKMSVKLSGSPSYLSSIPGVSFIEWKEIPEESFMKMLHIVPTDFGVKARLDRAKQYPMFKTYMAEINFDAFGEGEILLKGESNDAEKDLWGGSFHVVSRALKIPEGVPDVYYGRAFLFKNQVYILRSYEIAVAIHAVFNEDGDTIRAQTYCNMEIKEK